MTQPTTIELFAGIGGFSSSHTHPLAFVEKEPTCRAILRRHYPDALILDDVRTAGARNLPWANVIKFGFPCQDLSVAGNRAGITGARSGLFYEATRIVNELRPDYALWENVPGLLSSGAGRDFLAVLTELDRIGFAGGWTTLDAQFFGVAQRRQRVFGVFARRDIGAARCAEILSLAARLPWNLATGRKARQSVAATIRAGSSGDGVNRPGRRGDDDQNIIAMRTAQTSSNGWGVDDSGTSYTLDNTGGGAVLAPAIALSNRGRDTGDVFETVRAGSHGALPMVASALSASHGGADDNDAQAGHIVAVSIAENQRGELRTSDIAAQLTHGGGKPGQGYPAVLAFDWQAGDDSQFTEDGRGRKWIARAGDYTGAIGSTRRDGVAGGFGVRRLTPVECERLQGFPDDYTAWGIDESGARIEMSDSVRYRMLGNAICKKVSAWLDLQIVRYL